MAAQRRIREGDTVTLPAGYYDRAGSNAYGRIQLGDTPITLRVTRAYDARLIVRGPVLGGGQEASFYCYRSHILTVNEERTEAGQTYRPLGTKPADTPEMTYIGLDHPGIQWLFQDMGQYADNRGWCETYDDLAVDLGIPPREREYSVSHVHNGVMVHATIRARDEETAQSKLIEMFA